jgi:hypothetical protein
MRRDGPPTALLTGRHDAMSVKWRCPRSETLFTEGTKVLEVSVVRAREPEGGSVVSRSKLTDGL